MLKPKIALLLTATIDPRDCSFVKRSEPALRLADYILSIKQWLAEPNIHDVIFCENSGSSLEQIDQLVRTDNQYRKQIRLLSYKTEGEGNKGKGYGELGIIKEAITSCDLPASTHLLKVTGRYYVENIGQIVEDIELKGASITTGAFLLPYPGWIATECFCGTVEFFQQHFCPMQTNVDDSIGKWFEQALVAAVQNATQAGLTHAVFSKAPRLVGISGGSGLPWESTYSAQAPVINSDGSITIRDKPRLQLLEKLLRARIALCGTQDEETSVPSHVEELLAALISSTSRQGDLRVNNQDLLACEEALSFCTHQKWHGGLPPHLDFDLASAAKLIDLLTGNRLL